MSAAGATRANVCVLLLCLPVRYTHTRAKMEQNFPYRQTITCRTGSTGLCWARAVVLKLIWSGGLMEKKKNSTHRRGDKRKGQCCLSPLTSNKPHVCFSLGGYELSIQKRSRRRGRTKQKTEWESGGKQAFPRITPTLPGPAQFATTKQPPCSHRGTCGQPPSSPWEK